MTQKHGPESVGKLVDSFRLFEVSLQGSAGGIWGFRWM